MKSKCGAALLLMLVLVMACAGALAADTYTVTFDVNDNVPDPNDPSGTITIPNITMLEPRTQNVTAGGTVTTPTAPTAAGYVFGGWYTDVNCTSEYNFNTQVQQDYTLYAKWMLAVTFNANAPTSTTVDNMPATVNVPIGAPVGQPADPTAVGYTFGGWYTTAQCEENNKYNFSTKVTSALNLYAKWTRITHTVTFDPQGGIFTVTTPVTVNHGATVTKPDDPTKDGYTFGGWYKEPTCATEFKFSDASEPDPDTVTKDIKLYAKWSIKQYKVTFNNNGHGVQPPQQTVNYNEKARNPGDLVEQGWKFVRWYYLDASGKRQTYNFSWPVTGNIDLYAGWIQQHTVTFNMNGHGKVIKPVTVDHGGTVSVPDPAPTAEGYAFGGWYQDANFKIPFGFDQKQIKGNTTIHAKWTANVKVKFQWQKAITHTGADPTGSAQVQLMIDGREATTTEANGTNPVKTLAPETTAIWSGLDAGHTYSVTAKDVQGNYTAVCTQTGENTFLITYVENEKLSVATITNKHEVDKIDMVISKYWDDNDNRHRPESIQVRLMQVKNGTTVAVTDNNGNPIVLTLNNSNHWTAHVPNLFMRENGTTIQYIIEEVGEVKGYKATCEIVVDAQGNYTVRVTNVLTGKLDLEGWKEWDDDNDRDGIRPQSVQLKIYENRISSDTLVKNVIVDASTANPNDANMWKWTVEDLPVYDKYGQPITYIVVEDPVPAGYTASAPQYIPVGTTQP